MKNTLYITTAIPYVNAKPHIGNAIDYLIADIWARYHIQHGQKVRFQVGTDEHGNKIAKKAKENGLDPKSYVDQNFKNFQTLMDKLSISYTDFVRTTDEHHIATSQHIWQKLVPYIYKNKYTGWYCQGCESFVTDKDAGDNGGICPDHKTPYERVEEENYFFKTSAFGDRIKSAIESGEFQILPEIRKNEFLNLIKDGLTDVSISRPRKSLSWGIEVPGDPEQVMYVWIDALANYLSVIGYPDNPSWQEVWPADVQVIGKDILRFHAGIWPSMLLALELPLPKRLLAHGHVHVGGVKMSKTIGNVVDPIEIIDAYGADAFRYFFSRRIPTQDDGDFTWEAFENAYNSELGNDFGNLISRVASMVNKYQAGVINDIEKVRHDEMVFGESMQSLKFNEALDEIWVNIRGLNRYIDSIKPWEIAKKAETDPEAKAHLAEVLEYAVGGILNVSRMLWPFMPTTSEKINLVFASGVIALPEEPLFKKIYIHTPNPHASKAN